MKLQLIQILVFTEMQDLLPFNSETSDATDSEEIYWDTKEKTKIDVVRPQHDRSKNVKWQDR